MSRFVGAWQSAKRTRINVFCASIAEKRKMPRPIPVPRAEREAEELRKSLPSFFLGSGLPQRCAMCIIGACSDDMLDVAERAVRAKWDFAHALVVHGVHSSESDRERWRTLMPSAVSCNDGGIDIFDFDNQAAARAMDLAFALQARLELGEWTRTPRMLLVLDRPSAATLGAAVEGARGLAAVTVVALLPLWATTTAAGWHLRSMDHVAVCPTRDPVELELLYWTFFHELLPDAASIAKYMDHEERGALMLRPFEMRAQDRMSLVVK